MVLLGVWAPIHAGDNSLGLKVPPGFEVSEYSDSSLANDIFSMALDPQGRVVVSGRGYIRLLVDDHKSGKATRAIDLADGPKEGAQGLLWEGSWLYFTADGGLQRYRINSAGDKVEGPAELIRAMKTGGEHCAHAIRRGPDGWLYVLCGNSTGINKSYAQLPTSPIQNPVAGCVLRFSPDLKTSEIVADGFRNPYDMDFNPNGELFTFDSDNERCVSLPWYESTRFYQVIPGGHYGWLAPQRAETWRLPPYFFDVVAPIAYLGRGSPTGVSCYRHVQFPEEYQGGMFLCDWTFGKVYFLSLKKTETTYTFRKKVFLESVGDNGFAPTAIAVHPKTGDLFISIGGRGTRGAVYRLRYPQRSGSIDASALAKFQVKQRYVDWKEKMAEPREYRPDAKNDIPGICKLISSDPTAPEMRLIGVRIIQLALGELVHPKQKGTVWEGYTFRQEPQSSGDIIPALASAFPSGHADLDREISRTLAALEDE
ncbi:MAG TPA: hypothetical protein VGY77_03310, partial [Gemmataceae bacterium]|nr:hypothetical protein [Gemmataceae bacterium]